MFALEYHEATKHEFHRFAQSAGFLDWATQPNPFRRFDSAPLIELRREPVLPDLPYETLYASRSPAVPITWATVADLLRCSLGLSAWKQYQTSRWALRVNPSSGNLHPTEAYVVWAGSVYHYAPRDHALEQRCRLCPMATDAPIVDDSEPLLVGLTSILWREAWKYGERSFRYCQHDIGHAIGAIRLAAARFGWQVTPIDASDETTAALLGLDRADDFLDSEREVPEYLALITVQPRTQIDIASLVARAQAGSWSGTANRLSPRQREWPVVEEVATATHYPGGARFVGRVLSDPPQGRLRPAGPKGPALQIEQDDERRAAESSQDEGPSVVSAPDHSIGGAPTGPTARGIILQRRSAVAFDGRSTLPFSTFRTMLNRLRPGSCPWDAIDWPPQVHLAIFVHRVDGLVPGLYAFLRDPDVQQAWRAAMRPEFLWERIERNDSNDPNDLFLLLPTNLQWPAMRVSCDQEIAGDGFFSLGMIARFERALREHGEWFYRRLFWECGLIGQVLYLEAEAAGARATGIGCFFDDPVHELLGLSGRDWQSLYHFSMGMPVDDDRLLTEPGYEWEKAEMTPDPITKP